MPSHYSDIGFAFADPDDFTDFLKSIYDNGTDIPAKNGTYRCVTVDDRIEFWIQRVGNSIVGVEFHFAGGSAVPVRFDHWIEPRENLSGEAYVWYHPQKENLYPGGDVFPFVVSLPNADCWRELAPGQLIKLQIACYAEGFELYDSPEEFAAAQGGEVKYSDEFFIPSGTFNPDGSERTPTPNAIFAGHIQSFVQRTNSAGGGHYYCFKIRCQGADFDVLVDAELITREPRVGGVGSGSYWLSAKPVPDTEAGFQ